MIRNEKGRDVSETHVFLVPVFPSFATYAMCKAGAKCSHISTEP